MNKINMKNFEKHFFVVFTLFFVFILNSCLFGSMVFFSDLENLPPIIDNHPEVKKVSAESGDKKVTLKWKNPYILGFEKTVITYAKSSDNGNTTKTIEVGKGEFAAGAFCEKEIKNLENDVEYTFRLKTVYRIEETQTENSSETTSEENPSSSSGENESNTTTSTDATSSTSSTSTSTNPSDTSSSPSSENTENSSPNVVEKESEVVTVTATPKDLIPPSEIGNLEATEGEGQISFTWKDPTEEDFTEVLISDLSGKIKATVAKSAQTYLATDLENGKKYTFTFKTKDAKGNISKGISKDFSPKDLTPPGNVENFVATALDKAVELSWNAVLDADLDSYQISYNSSDMTEVKKFFVKKDETSVKIENLTNDLEYTFTIKAVDTSKNEGPSSSATATPIATGVTPTTPDPGTTTTDPEQTTTEPVDPGTTTPDPDPEPDPNTSTTTQTYPDPDTTPEQTP